MKKFLDVVLRLTISIIMIFITLSPVLVYQHLWFALLWFIFPGSLAMVTMEYIINNKLLKNNG